MTKTKIIPKQCTCSQNPLAVIPEQTVLSKPENLWVFYIPYQKIHKKIKHYIFNLLNKNCENQANLESLHHFLTQIFKAIQNRDSQQKLAHSHVLSVGSKRLPQAHADIPGLPGFNVP